MTSAELVTMLLADGRLPVGGHAHSGGLEEAVARGLTVERVPGYIEARLSSIVIVDAATAVVARHLALGAGSYDGLLQAWTARTPSDALRDIARSQGVSYLRLARRLWPGSAPIESAAGAPRPVVVGACSAVAGLSAAQTARLVAYDDVQTVASAALKLLPLDPLDVTGWLIAAAPAIERLGAQVAALTDAHTIPAPAALETELWAQHHRYRSRRLFRG